MVTGKMFEAYPAYILTGLLYASLLFLLSSGLNVVLGVLKILNLAHGSFYVLGAYLTTSFVALFVATGLPIYLVYIQILVAAAVAGVIGFIFEPTLLRPIYKREESYQLLLTFGILLVLSDVTKIVWGLGARVAPEPFKLLGSFIIGGIPFPYYNLLVIAVGFIVFLMLWFFFAKTRTGKIIRATATNREVTTSLGVNVPRTFTLVFVFGCFLGGLAGALAVPMQSIFPGLAMEMLVLSFVIVVIGGMGSLEGAFIGSIIVGIARSFGIVYFPEIELAILFIIMIIVLLVRPQGLFGRRE